MGWFASECKSQWIKLPKTDKEIDHVEGHHCSLGLLGCLGSIDCVHVGWDVCPASHQSDCVGKEGFLTLAFEVVTSHTRKILGVTEKFFGTWINKTTSKFDKVVQELRNEELYESPPWRHYDENGVSHQERRMHFVCNGGHNKWACLMPPYKHQIDGMDEKSWSDHLESIHKDVECSFGILKRRFAMLKNRLRLHNKEDIDRVFITCCVLHNMLHHWDGYDDWQNVEEQAHKLEESFVWCCI